MRAAASRHHLRSATRERFSGFHPAIARRVPTGGAGRTVLPIWFQSFAVARAHGDARMHVESRRVRHPQAFGSSGKITKTPARASRASSSRHTAALAMSSRLRPLLERFPAQVKSKPGGAPSQARPIPQRRTLPRPPRPRADDGALESSPFPPVHRSMVFLWRVQARLSSLAHGVPAFASETSQITMVAISLQPSGPRQVSTCHSSLSHAARCPSARSIAGSVRWWQPGAGRCGSVRRHVE
jgi:hypothetical protein